MRLILNTIPKIRPNRRKGRLTIRTKQIKCHMINTRFYSRLITGIIRRSLNESGTLCMKGSDGIYPPTSFGKSIEYDIKVNKTRYRF